MMKTLMSNLERNVTLSFKKKHQFVYYIHVFKII